MAAEAAYVPGRSGVYAATGEGYRAFHPKPLPPDPPLAYSAELIASLSAAAAELGRLDGAAEILPDPDFFVYSYVRKEAVLSSRIEGTRSSLADLFEFEAGAEGGRRRRDVREVANYVRGMNAAREAVRMGRPISVDLLKQTHAVLLKGVRGDEAEPGLIKSRQNWIGPVGGSPLTADFVPPPPEETITALAALELYVNSHSAEAPLIRAGVTHAQFETIHPFLDGNGRIGRLLITLMLIECGAVRRPVLYLSYFFLKNRDGYIRSLQRVRDDGDWEGWLMFFLEGVRETSVQAAETARAILTLRQEHERLLEAELGRRSGNAHRLLEHLFRTPVVSIGAVGASLNVTFPTANDLVRRFERLGLLNEITGQTRNRYFRYQPYIDVLQRDQTPTVPAATTATRSTPEVPAGARMTAPRTSTSASADRASE